MVDLQQMFRSLVLPTAMPSGNRLSAMPIPGSGMHRLAKNSVGAPCLLLSQHDGQQRPTPIQLENLQISYDVACIITRPDGTDEPGTFTIIACSATNPGLFPHFLTILSPILSALGPLPTSASIRRAINGLVELFHSLTAPSKKSIQGVWAELFVIDNSNDPVRLIAAWHRAPGERFDFADRTQRIEVKSSSGRRRLHHFSLAQLTPALGSHVIVASVFVERSGGGVSLRRLFDQVRARVESDPALQVAFDATFYASLGSGWSAAMDESFDSELAKESLAFFPVENVPSLERPIAPELSEVHFCSDLSSAVSMDSAELRAAGDMFAALVPRG